MIKTLLELLIFTIKTSIVFLFLHLFLYNIQIQYTNDAYNTPIKNYVDIGQQFDLFSIPQFIDEYIKER